MVQPAQGELFSAPFTPAPAVTASVPIEERIQSAKATLQRLLGQSKTLCVAFSSGKDSATCAALVLNAARDWVASGGDEPTVVVCHGNTRIENPEVHRLAREEMQKMVEYGARHGFRVLVDIAEPSLSEHYFVQILSGRTIANMPDGGKKCATMLKVAPITRQKRRLASAWGIDNIVTIIGTRSDESAERDRAMAARRESSTRPVRNAQGEWILSLIKDWSLDDVFEYLGTAKAGLIEAYSDFGRLLDLYRSMNAGVCELSIYTNGKPATTGCGARSGCWACLRRDVGNGKSEESLNNMVQDPDYAYMTGLAALRDYIAKTHYDPGRRNWLSRTVNGDGTITISPNSYSPAHCLDLLRYALTLDADEAESAQELGIAPRFEILRPQDVVAIDFLQARYGIAMPFTASYWYREIRWRGRRFPVPTDITAYPKRAHPEPVTVPFADLHYGGLFAGQRDIEAAMVDAESLTVKSNGMLYSGGGGTDEFRVDAEGAELFLAFELDHALSRYHRETVCPTTAVHYLLRLGTVELYRGQHKENDRMLRIASQIHRHGLRDVLSEPSALIERCNSAFGRSTEPGRPTGTAALLGQQL